MDVSRLHQHGLETMSRQARVQPLRHRPGLQPDQIWRVRRQDGSEHIRIRRHHALKDNMALLSTTQIVVVDSETSNPAKRFITVILSIWSARTACQLARD